MSPLIIRSFLSLTWGPLQTKTVSYNYRCLLPRFGKWISRDPINELGFQCAAGYAQAPDAETSEFDRTRQMLVQFQFLEQVLSIPAGSLSDPLEHFVWEYEAAIASGRSGVPEFSAEWNLYLMISNDPLNSIDIHGLSSWAIGLPAAGTCAALDGPLPIGDIIAIGILGCCALAELDKPHGCYPCIPSVGSTAFEVHTVPPARPHKPHRGTHTHHFQMHQSPWPICRCFWKRDYVPPTGGASPLPSEGPVVPAGGGGAY